MNEEWIKVTGKRGRRRNQLLYYSCETRGYWKLKEEAMDRTLWSTHFGTGYGPVVKRLENEYTEHTNMFHAAVSGIANNCVLCSASVI
jgi:hypothetical protein